MGNPKAAETGVSPRDYGKLMIKIKVDSAEGDHVNVQFPVKAAKKILNATGKLPINITGNDAFEDADMKDLMETIADCLDNEMVGNIVEVTSSDGTQVHVGIE